MKNLSLCMIVKDEELSLANCLESVKDLVEEIIIVDTGSTDKTKKIARKYTDKIFDFQWEEDFSAARNFSFSKATKSHIIWLDADDYISKENCEKIRQLKLEDADVFMLKYATAFDEEGKATFSFYRERIVRNDGTFLWQDPVHEVIVPHGEIKYEEIEIYHYKQKLKKNVLNSDRNLKIYLNYLKNRKILSPRQQFYFARELYFNNRIDEAIHEFSKFLSSGKGWKENNIEACLNLANCYMIKKEYSNALTALLGSFEMDLPRGEIVYTIGNVFYQLNRIQEAIFWYKIALSLKPNFSSGAFVDIDSYGFLPSLQLCVVYYNLGDYKKAKYYHEKCKKIKPNDYTVLNNEKFFNKKAGTPAKISI